MLDNDQLEKAIRQGIDDYMMSTSEYYLTQQGPDAWQDGLARYIGVRIGWAESDVQK